MTSRGKKKTTMAKLNREARLRERRVEKQARKDRRRDAAGAEPADTESRYDAEGQYDAEAQHEAARTEDQDAAPVPVDPVRAP